VKSRKSVSLDLLAAEAVDDGQGSVLKIVGKSSQLLELETVGVNHPLQADERHDLFAHIRTVFVDPPMIEEQPAGEHRVEIGVVRPHRPSVAIQIEAFADHDHRLFAGREGERAHAALVVVEIVNATRGIDEGLALRGAVQKNRPLWILAGRRSRNAERPVDPNGDIRRLETGQVAAVVALLHLVAHRQHFGWHGPLGERLRDRFVPPGCGLQEMGRASESLRQRSGRVTVVLDRRIHGNDCTRAFATRPVSGYRIID
jgi:hypothetical protein